VSIVKFVASRLVGLLATLLLTSFAIFGALYIAPGSPLSYLVGGRTVSPQVVAAVKAHYHLDDPFLMRYLAWIADLLHGRFGTSLVYKTDVTALIVPRTGITVWLLLYASLLIIVVGVALGVISGLAGRRTDMVVSGLATVGLATR
jgi:peptide/nickel transport system permease protein